MGLAADVSKWSEKAKRNARLVAMEAIQDTEDMMTERVPGLMRGAAFVEGKVPVDTSALINSHKPALLGGFELGDTVVSGFGGAAEKYAKHVEYGTSRMRGRFFVRNAVQKWSATVAAVAARFG